MKTRSLLRPSSFWVATLVVAAASCAQIGILETSTPSLTYPEARVCDQVDEYHGIHVADPYRWMESEPDTPEIHAEIEEWIEAENVVTRGFLDAIPERQEILDRLTELWNFERVSSPSKRGDRLFFRRNDGLQSQSVLYVQDGFDGTPRVLLDPNELSKDGTVALANVVPSPDGKLIAYGLSDGGSDWRTWHFMDVESGKKLPDVVRWNKFGGLDWTYDSHAVVYTRYPTPKDGDELTGLNEPASIYLHSMGTSQGDDIVLRGPPEEEGVGQWVMVTNSRKAAIVLREQASTDKHEIELVSLLPDSKGAGIWLARGFDAQYDYVGNTSERIWFRSNLDAPRWRIIGIDLQAPERENWRVVVPESTETMVGAGVAGGRIVASYLKDATGEIRVFETDGTFVEAVDLPGIGSVSGLSGEADDPVAFYSFTNQVTPAKIYRYDVPTGESTLFFEPKLRFDPEDYQVEQVFYPSKDGTRIPMFLAHRKGLARNGNNPTYLYGYGGFNVSITPRYSNENLAWMEMGGILAVPNIRGGGEYGEAWHQAGTKLKKQNVFDDFIAAAEWLIDNDYTRSEKLVIAGASNGGLLVGACMSQRPDLFGAALPAVGVMDMLRYHLFTIGWAWAGDYGTSGDPEEFLALFAYSPLHNLRSGVSYPATLVTTADHDDRVVPAHSFKFAARLQATHEGDAPVLIRIATRAGHGSGKPTAMRIEEAADKLAFLVEVLDI